MLNGEFPRGEFRNLPVPECVGRGRGIEYVLYILGIVVEGMSWILMRACESLTDRTAATCT